MRLYVKLSILLTVFFILLNTVFSVCPNNCSGHGKCDKSTCSCYSDSESGEYYLGADCSLRGCGVGNPFSAVGSVYGSGSKVYSSSSSSRELSNEESMKYNIRRLKNTFPLSLKGKNALDKGGMLWEVSGIETLVEALPPSGGILSCTFTPPPSSDEARILDNKVLSNQLNVISVTSTAIYALFEDAVTSIGDGKGATYSSVTCDDILTVRNDLTQFNPTVIPKKEERLLSNNNSTRILNEEQGSKPTFAWNGYFPILRDMGLLKQNSEGEYRNDNFIFACYKPPSTSSTSRELTGDGNEIIGVELTVYAKVTAVKAEDNDDVQFTITGETVPGDGDVCLCAMDDDGNPVVLEESDIAENIRKEEKDKKTDVYKIGKYKDTNAAKADHVAFGSVASVTAKEITGVAIAENDDDKLYFGVNRIVYGTVLENGYFKEVEVKMSEIDKATLSALAEGTFLLPYLRSAAISQLTPPPKQFVVDKGSDSFYKAYYFPNSLYENLKKEGGILKCKYTPSSRRERILKDISPVEVEVDVKGIIKDSKGVAIYSYIELPAKDNEGKDVSYSPLGTLECDGIKSIRNDMTKYKGLSPLTLAKSNRMERQLGEVANTIQWDGYGPIFTDMGFTSDKVNFACFKTNDNSKKIETFKATISYVGNTLIRNLADTKPNVVFTFTASSKDEAEDYLCFMTTKFNKKDTKLEESDIKNRIVYDSSTMSYYYGEYLMSSTTRYVREGDTEAIVLSKDSVITLTSSEPSARRGLGSVTGSITIPDYDNIQSDIQSELNTLSTFSLKIIRNSKSKYEELVVNCEVSTDSSTVRSLKDKVINFHASSAEGNSLAVDDIPFYVIYLTIPTSSPEPPYIPPNKVRNIDVNSYFYEVTNFLDDIKQSLPLIGGKIECKVDEENNMEVIDVRGIVDDRIYLKLEKPLSVGRRLLSVENGIILENIRDCRILSSRKDMSLYNILKLDNSNYKNGIISWIGYGEIFLSIKGNIVCYTPSASKDPSQMIIYSNIEIYRSRNNNNNYDINILFRDEKPKNGDVCYMLSDSNGLSAISIGNSELKGIVHSDKTGNYYFGGSIIGNSGKGEEIKKPDGSVEISFTKEKYVNDKSDERFNENNANKIDLLDINSKSSPSLYVPSDMIGIESEKMVVIGNTVEIIFLLNGNPIYQGNAQILKIEKDELGRNKLSLSNQIYLPSEILSKSRLRSLATPPESPDILVVLNWKSEGSTHVSLECSGQGICDRESGLCKCFAGYSGSYCQRLDCPNNCNGNGRCVALSELLNNEDLKDYIGFGNKHIGKYKYESTDKDIQFDNQVYGCLCDKRHRGYDCSLIECPSTKDPEGATNIVSAANPPPEYRDCSGRGICNYETGVCECFDGFYGEGCQEQIGTM